MTPILAMVWIKPGTFVMGSPGTEAGRDSNEGPQTVVTLTKGFWMGHHEVTQGEYKKVMGSNPNAFTGDLNLPVGGVTFDEAKSFCASLTTSERTAGRLPAGWGYRLPTEAEWEYACRASSTARFCYGDDLSVADLGNYAWYSANSGNTTHPVGQKLANRWGLVDMHANAREWCEDPAGDYPGGSVTDPQGAGSGDYRVVRGSSGNSQSELPRCATRSAYTRDWRAAFLGFRTVLAPSAP